MVARIAPLAVVVLVFVVACYDDPLGVLKPDGARPSHTSETPSGSGIFDGAESFVAGNPMRNFAGGAPYNYGYYSDGPDAGDGWNDSDQARIAIPHDSLLVDLTNFSFETWVRISYSSEWEFGVIALNSNHQTNSTGQLDLGYFALDYEQYSPGLMEFAWRVSSYSGGVGGWSVIRALPPPLDPDSGRVMHVVGVHEANVISLYIDGSLAATADISFRQDLSDVFGWGGDIEKPLMIAGSQCTQDDPTCYQALAGSIGESAFYRRALTPTEIQEHYQVGTGTPPAQPDSLSDPYRDLVLSHQPDGYWRHRESDLHGLATIEGEQVVDASGNAWHGDYRAFGTTPEPLSIALDCPTSAVRGEEITCFATVAPGEARVSFWRFDPDSVTIHPQTGPLLTALPVLDDSSFSTAWTGALVLPGRIMIEAVLGPDFIRDSADIVIEARPWTTDTLWYGRVQTEWALQPVTNDSLTWKWGKNLHVADSAGTLQFSDAPWLLRGFRADAAEPVDTTHFRTVSNGPNAGYMYIAKYPVTMSRGYRINRFMTQNIPVTDIRYQGNYYNRWDALIALGWGKPQDALNGTVEHESFGPDAPKGHQDALLEAIDGDRCGNAAIRLERIAGAPLEVEAQITLLENYVREFLTIASSHIRVNGHHGSAGSPFVLRRTAWNFQPDLGHIPDQPRDHHLLDLVQYRNACEYEELGI